MTVPTDVVGRRLSILGQKAFLGALLDPVLDVGDLQEERFSAPRRPDLGGCHGCQLRWAAVARAHAVVNLLERRRSLHMQL